MIRALDHHLVCWLQASTRGAGPQCKAAMDAQGAMARGVHQAHSPQLGNDSLLEGGSEQSISVSAADGMLSNFKQMTNDQTQYFEKQWEILRPIELNTASEYINISTALSLFSFLTPYTNLHTHTPCLLIFVIIFSSHKHLKIHSVRNPIDNAWSDPKRVKKEKYSSLYRNQFYLQRKFWFYVYIKY